MGSRIQFVACSPSVVCDLGLAVDRGSIDSVGWRFGCGGAPPLSISVQPFGSSMDPEIASENPVRGASSDMAATPTRSRATLFSGPDTSWPHLVPRMAEDR